MKLLDVLRKVIGSVAVHVLDNCNLQRQHMAFTCGYYHQQRAELAFMA